MSRPDDTELSPTRDLAWDSGMGPTQSLYGDVLGNGALVGAYAIDAERSQGGFGVVYRATHLATARPVAIKVLHRHFTGSPDVIRRFHREASTVQRIRHANSVELLDIGELADGRPYLVMEWLEGATLEERLRDRGAFRPAEAAWVLEGLAGALGAAHAAGVVHRDLKASNVIITAGPDPVVKLLDFGIAKLLDGEQLTSTGVRLGTPGSMAPEVILGLPITPAADVYSLGVLLYQLLTGRPPFQADTPLGMDHKHLHEPPPRVSEASEVPPEVDAVLERALDKDPLRRHQDVGALVAELREAMAGRAPAGRFTAATVTAVGLRVELDGAAAPDLLDELRRRCEEARLDIAFADERGLLAAAVPQPGTELDLRARVLALALALDRESRRAGQPAARLTVHAATVATLYIEGVRQYVGGPLVETDDWTQDRPAGAVAATAPAWAGLEGRFELGPGGPAATRVVHQGR